LEGTGSLILDRVNRKAYCALSPRADEDLFIEFCEDFESTPVSFHAYQTIDGERKLIYHTNMMMAMTERSVIIYLDAIDDKKEGKNIIRHLKEDGKEIISISEDQVNHFVGNMLQVIGKNYIRYIVMSKTAYHCLTPDQIQKIELESDILFSDVTTIETVGGGSVRCMMGEAPPPKSPEGGL